MNVIRCPVPYFCYSAGSVGKDYYSDPKYLNVLTGAVGKLQEVIPSSTDLTPQHPNGRNGTANNPKKGPKTFTAVPTTKQQQQPSIKFPQVGTECLITFAGYSSLPFLLPFWAAAPIGDKVL